MAQLQTELSSAKEMNEVRRYYTFHHKTLLVHVHNSFAMPGPLTISDICFVLTVPAGRTCTGTGTDRGK